MAVRMAAVGVKILVTPKSAALSHIPISTPPFVPAAPVWICQAVTASPASTFVTVTLL